MANTITHTMETWFNESYDTTVLTPLDFYNNKFMRRKLDTYKVPYSFAERFDTDDKLAFLFNSIGQGYIDLIIKLKPILKTIPFGALEEEDRIMLREFVCAQTEFGTYNRQIIEIVDQSSLSTSSITINTTQTGWVFTSDMLSKRGALLMQNSSIDAYDWVVDTALYTYSKNKNLLILASTDLDSDVPSIVWDQI